VLQELEREKLDQKQRSVRRRKRHHPLPVELERQRVVLEPADRLCPASGQARPQIGTAQPGQDREAGLGNAGASRPGITQQ
jgi:hypothetical protein